MVIVREPEEIDNYLFEYHSTLVSVIFSKIASLSPRRIVEIGSGTGNVTIPLVKKLDHHFEVLCCVDSYPGPYKCDRERLESRLKKENSGNKRDNIEIYEMDAREIGTKFSDIDLVIGHEVLCDLNSDQVKQVMSASYDILKESGIFVHADLSPIPLNRSEKLVHIINEYSEEPISNTPWFSPGADELAGIAHEIGFRSIDVHYVKIPIKFYNTAVFEMLRRWRTKSEFQERYLDEIERIGIEFPMEQILYCIK